MGDYVFCGPRSVCRAFLDVYNQVLHVGEAWEQFSFKYQDEREQLFSNRVSPEFLKGFVWEISLGD